MFGKSLFFFLGGWVGFGAWIRGLDLGFGSVDWSGWGGWMWDLESVLFGFGLDWICFGLVDRKP